MPTTTTETTATTRNLGAAFERALNAHSWYLAFAAKAEIESLLGIASLFRAAASAKQIHAENHARVLMQLGGDARCEFRGDLPDLS